MLKTYKLFALLMALAILAGCTGQQPAPADGSGSPGGTPASSGASGTHAGATVQEGTLIVAVDAEGTTFDPFNYADLDDGMLVRAVHEPLAYLDSGAASGFSPVLAESWEYPNERTIRLRLRKGVIFQNGEEMKASDVLFSLRMTKDKGLLNPDNWKNLNLDGAKILDDYTLEIGTFEPSSFSFSWLLSEMISILSEKAYTEAGDKYGRFPNGGTGPYILADWVAGDRVVFARNEKYWGTMPQYHTMIFRFMVEGTARTFAVESGDVDVAYSCSPADREVLLALKDYDVIRQPTSGVNYLFMNNRDPYLKDVRVRQALAYALDLKTMVPIAWNNMGTVAFSMFGPTAAQQVRPDKVYALDMEKAKALLAEAGHAKGFNLKIVITDRAPRKAMSEMMKNAWANLNVNLEIEVLELSTILGLIRSGDYQLTILAEGGFHGEAWRSYLHSGGGNNYAKYANPRVDELFEKAVKALDVSERTAYYTELQNIFAEELPMLPLQYDEKLNVVRKGMRYAVDPTYNFMAVRFYYIRYGE